MDERTLEKYREQERIRHHLLQGHRGQLPPGVDIAKALADGRYAADMLDHELVTRGLRAEIARLHNQIHQLETSNAASKKQVHRLHMFPERQCSFCGVTYTPTHHMSAYCSDACKRAAIRSRRQHKQAAAGED